MNLFKSLFFTSFSISSFRLFALDKVLILMYRRIAYAIEQYQEAEICKTNSTIADSETTIFIYDDTEMVSCNEK